MSPLQFLLASAATSSVWGAEFDILQAFSAHQTLQSFNTRDVESFEINGHHYLVLANYLDAHELTHKIDSKLYRWDSALQEFILHQRIGTYGATAFKAFTISDEHYLSVANRVGPSDTEREKPDVPRECYTRGNQFPEDAVGVTPGDLAKSLEDCVALCSNTADCGFFRYNVDKDWCELFHKQQSKMKYKREPASAFFSGTILGNCSISGQQMSPEPSGPSGQLSQNGNQIPNYSKIYKWDGEFFVEYQSIVTEGATDIEFFANNGEQYLAISMSKALKLFRWSNSVFVDHQYLTARNAMDVELFQIDGKQYLVLANNHDGDQFCINSIIYRWEDADSVHWPDAVQHIGGALVEHQELPTNGAYSIEAFTVDEVPYVAVANYQPLKDDLESNIFQWDGKIFRHHQLLSTKGAIGFEAFKMDEHQILAVTSHFTPFSKLYRFDTAHGTFVEFQTLKTIRARSFKAFAISGEQYLAVVNSLHSDAPLLIYRAPLPCNIANSNHQPGSACRCNHGYAGGVWWHGSAATGECVPAECNIENSNHEDGLECACEGSYQGSIEWKGSSPHGSCTLNPFLLIGIPILVVVSLATSGTCVFLYRKRVASYANFEDSPAAEVSSTPGKSDSEISATVVGSKVQV